MCRSVGSIKRWGGGGGGTGFQGHFWIMKSAPKNILCISGNKLRHMRSLPLFEKENIS